MTYRFIWINVILIIIVFAVLTSCESVSYYGKIISGQMAILNKRQPIKKLLAEPLTPKRLKRVLGSGRNMVRSALGGEFPSCTLSVCAVGS
jgi:predicted aminopeptidase